MTTSISLTAYELELNARIAALGDFGRKSVLNYLAGYAPEVLVVALDDIERQAAADGT